MYIVSGSWDNTVAILDVKSLKILKKFTDIHKSKIIIMNFNLFNFILAEVRSVVFSPNGEYLATGSCDGTVNLFEASKFGEVVHRFDDE